MPRFAILFLALPLLAGRAAPPPAVVSALENLRAQRSYSWEVINGDPGPVAREIETRRGTVTTVQRNTAPETKGSIDLAGDTLLRREWSDGLRLDTLITAGGDFLTLTPDGWLTTQEILTAQADERLRATGPTSRALWLRRADRPEVLRPDQELVHLLKSDLVFENTAPDTYVVRLKAGEDSANAGVEATFTLHLRSGVLRNYEVLLEGSRTIPRSRARMPISENRLVVITYVPVRRVDVPAEAREKLKPATKR